MEMIFNIDEPHQDDLKDVPRTIAILVSKQVPKELCFKIPTILTSFMITKREWAT